MQTCKTSQECILFDGTHAYCSDGHCGCPINHHPATDLIHCVPSVDIGDVCENDENCNYTSAECFNKTCRCIPDYVKINKRSCLKGK